MNTATSNAVDVNNAPAAVQPLNTAQTSAQRIADFKERQRIASLDPLAAKREKEDAENKKVLDFVTNGNPNIVDIVLNLVIKATPPSEICEVLAIAPDMLKKILACPIARERLQVLAESSPDTTKSVLGIIQSAAFGAAMKLSTHIESPDANISMAAIRLTLSLGLSPEKLRDLKRGVRQSPESAALEKAELDAKIKRQLDQSQRPI